MELTNSLIIDRLKSHKQTYQTGKPFPHIIIDKLWNEFLLENIEDEFDSYNCWDGEKEFFGSINKRFSNNIENFRPYTKSLIQFCNSSYFIGFLEDLTGVCNLYPDPKLIGGGMHSTGRNGFLKMHVDFNWSEQIKMYRRINLLIYLNKYWDSSWNGQLLLGSKNLKNVIVKKQIKPLFNRTVIFNTDLTSWHGHPFPLKCPKHVRRNSIALYYYTIKNEFTKQQRFQTVYLK